MTGTKGGRPRKPTNLHLLHGESRPSRVNRNEPKPQLGVAVVAPEYLMPGARAVWDRVAPLLEMRGVLTAWDVDLFAIFCTAVEVHRQAAAMVAEHGLTSSGPQGGLVKHPAVSVMREAAQTMTTVGGRFGLTPADRAAITVPPQEESGGGAAAILD